jgi:hypothetical protein
LSSNEESSSTGAAETSRSRSWGKSGVFLTVATAGMLARTNGTPAYLESHWPQAKPKIS